MTDLSFRLEGVMRGRGEAADFEGPLSLILMLLSKNKIEIRDISIAEILDQYLAYLDEMQSMDLEIASEFVQMAAHLLYIKTKTLLSGEDEVSELAELISSLEQLKCRDAREAVRAVTPALAEASQRGLLLFVRAQEPPPEALRAYAYRHEPADLLAALYGVFTRAEAKIPGPPELRSIAPPRIIYGVRDKSREIVARLKDGSVSLRELYATGRSRSEVVATFLSVLELCAIGSISIAESGEDFILSLIPGAAEEMIESIEE